MEKGVEAAAKKITPIKEEEPARKEEPTEEVLN